MDEEFEKFLGQIKSDQKEISPEDKILLDEANELLKHCEEEEDFGPGYNPAKLDLQKFLFLKNLNSKQKVNKYLIQQLSWIAKKNILLRYLLIEAGLKNGNIEKLLKETDFYHIRNNPEDFYFDNNVPKELRFFEITLKLKQKQFSILNPEESSYLVISNKTEEIAKNKIEEFAKNLELKMEHAFRVLIYSNKHKDNPIEPTQDILLKETADDLKKYLKGIKDLYLYWSRSLVEAEFFKKSQSSEGSFIIYLNNMYWLNIDKFQKFIEGFFFFPNLLIELYDKHKTGAELYFDKFNKYINSVETEKLKKDFRIAELVGANQTYQKALEDRQEEQRKKIDNMAESYVQACISFNTEKPTIKMLSTLTTISSDIWKKQLSNSTFLFNLLKKLESKRKIAKNNIPFWTGAYTYINKKLGNALQDKKVKNQSYDDEVDYNRESGKKKKSNYNSDDI